MLRMWADDIEMFAGSRRPFASKQITTARVATQTADTVVSNEMKALPEAFRAQADMIKEKTKNELHR